MGQEQVFTVGEAAQRLGLKVRTVRQWLRDGKIKSVRTENGWNVRIPESELSRLTVERFDENKN